MIENNHNLLENALNQLPTNKPEHDLWQQIESEMVQQGVVSVKQVSFFSRNNIIKMSATAAMLLLGSGIVFYRTSTKHQAIAAMSSGKASLAAYQNELNQISPQGAYLEKLHSNENNIFVEEAVLKTIEKELINLDEQSSALMSQLQQPDAKNLSELTNKLLELEKEKSKAIRKIIEFT
jgi:hypothetical protein